jgi:hypothetical protein
MPRQSGRASAASDKNYGCIQEPGMRLSGQRMVTERRVHSMMHARSVCPNTRRLNSVGKEVCGKSTPRNPSEGFMSSGNAIARGHRDGSARHVKQQAPERAPLY